MIPWAAAARGTNSWPAVAVAILALAVFRPGIAAAFTVEAIGATAAAAPAIPEIRLPVVLAVTPVTANPKSGEPVEVAVALAFEAGVVVAGPVLGTDLGDWTVLRIVRGQSEHRGLTESRVDRLTLLTYAEGKTEIPALVAHFRTADGKAGEARSTPVAVTLQPAAVTPDGLAARLRDIKRPLGFFPWAWLVIGLLAAAGAAAGAWWWRRRSQSAGADAPAIPRLSPEEEARERLAALYAKNYLAERLFKPYYSELSEILRVYIQRRLGVDALDRTTQELMHALKRVNVNRGEVVVIRQVLDRSDLVKFAKGVPEEREADDDGRAVAEFVEHNEPRSETPSGPAAGESAPPSRLSPGGDRT